MVRNALAVDPEVSQGGGVSSWAREMSCWPATERLRSCCSPLLAPAARGAWCIATPACESATPVSCLLPLPAHLPTLAAAARVCDAGVDAGGAHPCAQLCGSGHAHPEGCCGHLLRPAWPGHSHTRSLWPPSHGGSSSGGSRSSSGGSTTSSGGRRAATIATTTPLVVTSPRAFQCTCSLLPAPAASHCCCCPCVHHPLPAMPFCQIRPTVRHSR